MDKSYPIPQIKPKTGVSPARDTTTPEANEGFTKITPPAHSEVNNNVLADDATGDRTQLKSTMLDKIDSQLKSIFRSGPKNKKILIAVGVALVLFLLGLLIPGLFVYKDVRAVLKSVDLAKAAVASQNIDQVKSEIVGVKSSLTKLSSSYRLLGLARVVPFVSNYYLDGRAAINGGLHGLEAGEVLIDTISPYADIIGFAGEANAKSGAENAEDRLEFIVETVGDITPKLPEISEKVSLAQAEFSKINPNRYPEKLGGRDVRAQLVEGLNLVDDAAKLLVDARPILEQAPYLLGVDGERTYLLIFQNDKELRPTGGFMTAYSIMRVSKGKISQVTSNDIYHLDTRYRPVIPAPDPIVRYIKGPYIQSKNLRIRDMNFDPDFKTSMDMFYKEAQKVGIRDIDGIIAVDTNVLEKILNVIGEIGVPGFGNYSTKIIPECNCPQVIYELESFADIEGPIIWDPVTGEIILRPPNSDNRKAIVGPLMNSILTNAMGQPKEKMPDLFKAGLDSLLEKHVLFYLLDENAQAAAESFNVAGRINEFDGDYLHINDSNLGGRKSNMYVTQEVLQEINVKNDGTIEKTVTITYKNPEKHDGWLNSVLPNWVRIYVPEGSELVDFAGVTDKEEPYSEFGKTVFAGHFELRPLGVAKVTVTYKLPFKADKQYKLLVQKQPGTTAPLHSIRLGKVEEELFLKTDREFRFSLR